MTSIKVTSHNPEELIRGNFFCVFTFFSLYLAIILGFHSQINNISLCSPVFCPLQKSSCWQFVLHSYNVLNCVLLCGSDTRTFFSCVTVFCDVLQQEEPIKDSIRMFPTTGNCLNSWLSYVYLECTYHHLLLQQLFVSIASWI